MLIALGFEVRIRGSHHLFRHEKYSEKTNIQRDGSHAKPYQVKQVRNILLRNKLVGLLMKYEIIIYWSNKDQLYIAEVPELAGCMAHGNTYETALQNVTSAIQHWIETTKELMSPFLSQKAGD